MSQPSERPPRCYWCDELALTGVAVPVPVAWPPTVATLDPAALPPSVLRVERFPSCEHHYRTLGLGMPPLP